MPDDRMIHRRAGRSKKVSGLTDFEFRVWVQFQLSADDFGVMLRSAAKLQSDNAAIEKRTARQIDRAIDALVKVGLLDAFEHQGDWYLFQPDWQDYQKVKHARHTVQPFPPARTLAACSSKTRALFLEQHNGRIQEEVPQDFSNPSETFTPLAHAGARETATANGRRLPATGFRQTAAAPIRHPRSMGALGSSPAQHIGHARCNDRGLCIPQALYVELLGRFANDMTRFDAFYEGILAQMPDDFVPSGSVFRFWHDMLERAHPNLTPKVNVRQAALEADF
jgi:hypothetical protein